MPTHESVGIDPGLKQNITAVSNDGTILQITGFNSKPRLKTKRRLLRKMQRQRDAALQDGRARFIRQKTRTGKTKQRFRWTEQPSIGYLKTMTQLRKVEQKRPDSMTGYQHRISHQIICIKHTATANMTRSAKGTIENPGRNSGQKSGLNRTILAQSWYGTRVNLEYKPQWYSRNFVAVPAHHTSQRCSRYGYAEASNRVSQEEFRYLTSRHETNADINAEENVRHQGVEILDNAGNIIIDVPPETHGFNKRHTTRPRADSRCTHELALHKE